MTAVGTEEPNSLIFQLSRQHPLSNSEYPEREIQEDRFRAAPAQAAMGRTVSS